MNHLLNLLEQPALSGIASVLTIATFAWSLLSALRRGGVKKAICSSEIGANGSVPPSMASRIFETLSDWPAVVPYVVSSIAVILLGFTEVILFKYLFWDVPFDPASFETRAYFTTAPVLVCSTMYATMAVLESIESSEWSITTSDEFDKLRTAFAVPFAVGMLLFFGGIGMCALHSIGWL